LEAQLQRELDYPWRTECVHTGAETKPQTVGLWVCRSVRRAWRSVQNAAEGSRRPVKVGHVEQIEERDSGPKFQPVAEAVGPAQAQIESLEPGLADGASRSQGQRRCASGRQASDNSSQFLQLRQGK